MKGIIFTPEMRQAVIAGRKTQTRRLGRLKEINLEPEGWTWTFYEDDQSFAFSKGNYFTVIKPHYRFCEIVYLKEPWITESIYDSSPIPDISHDALICYKDTPPEEPLWSIMGSKWRSALFMPAWVARHFIQITDVRVGRLQEITPQDIEAEGIKQLYFTTGVPLVSLPQFKHLWNSINKPPYDWDSNPWVWVYSFKYLIEGLPLSRKERDALEWQRYVYSNNHANWRE